VQGRNTSLATIRATKGLRRCTRRQSSQRDDFHQPNWLNATAALQETTNDLKIIRRF
jgi:hypothetical protein